MHSQAGGGRPPSLCGHRILSPRAAGCSHPPLANLAASTRVNYVKLDKIGPKETWSFWEPCARCPREKGARPPHGGALTCAADTEEGQGRRRKLAGSAEPLLYPAGGFSLPPLVPTQHDSRTQRSPAGHSAAQHGCPSAHITVLFIVFLMIQKHFKVLRI